jgi:hypothetical protein
MRLALPIAMTIALVSAPAGALEDEDFLVNSAADLATLCSVSPDNPDYAAALHMCHGYLLGVHHMHTAMEEALEGEGVYCVPETDRPSRSEAIDSFVAWTGGRAGLDGTPALEALLTWAQAEFPCQQGAGQ